MGGEGAREKTKHDPPSLGASSRATRRLGSASAGGRVIPSLPSVREKRITVARLRAVLQGCLRVLETTSSRSSIDHPPSPSRRGRSSRAPDPPLCRMDLGHRLPPRTPALRPRPPTSPSPTSPNWPPNWGPSRSALRPALASGKSAIQRLPPRESRSRPVSRPRRRAFTCGGHHPGGRGREERQRGDPNATETAPCPSASDPLSSLARWQWISYPYHETGGGRSRSRPFQSHSGLSR